VPKDVQKGLAQYEQSGAQGFRPARIALAERYYAGTVVPQDYAAAFRWFSAAAEQRSPAAKISWFPSLAAATGGPTGMVSRPNVLLRRPATPWVFSVVMIWSQVGKGGWHKAREPRRLDDPPFTRSWRHATLAA
jgi:TPR repeat protein